MRAYNFAAGPAILPDAVLMRAQNEILDYKGSGMSVMEMSHRSPIYEKILNNAKDSLRRLMQIPESYEILFLQGGATLQFAMIPMNLMKSGKADYVLSGNFSKKAFEEAQKYGDAKAIASSKDRNFAYIPDVNPDLIRPDASYLHITTNNTIYGSCIHQNLPDTAGIPLVADMSSNILGEVYDINKFALIYAGAQKNIGPAGLTLVIIKKDLLGSPAVANTPSVMQYEILAKNNSMYNTPPSYGIYLAGLVFEHLESLGGVAAMQKANEEKAALLYKVLDESSFYTAPIDKNARSIMNVTFSTPNPETDQLFCKQASEAGLLNLKGHRVLGGIRASIYNAMPRAGVEALASFMKNFESQNS